MQRVRSEVWPDSIVRELRIAGKERKLDVVVWTVSVPRDDAQTISFRHVLRRRIRFLRICLTSAGTAEKNSNAEQE